MGCVVKRDWLTRLKYAQTAIVQAYRQRAVIGGADVISVVI